MSHASVRVKQAPARCYVKIIKEGGRGRGQAHMVRNDKIIAVADGVEVDISSAVTAWHEHNVVGSVRTVEIILLCHHVTQEDGQLIYEGAAPVVE